MSSGEQHEGHVLEHIVDHGGSVTLHTCDACVTPERLIEMYERAIREVRQFIAEQKGATSDTEGAD